MSKTPAFWDSSALVPACVNERGTARAKLLLRTFLPVVAWSTPVELYGAICRLHRDRQLSPGDKQGAILRLRTLSLSWREMIPDDYVRDLAIASLDQYPLRAGDALQLGAALIWCKERPAKRTFICADRRLAEAAESTGFSVLAFP